MSGFVRRSKGSPHGVEVLSFSGVRRLSLVIPLRRMEYEQYEQEGRRLLLEVALTQDGFEVRGALSTSGPAQRRSLEGQNNPCCVSMLCSLTIRKRFPLIAC